MKEETKSPIKPVFLFCIPAGLYLFASGSLISAAVVCALAAAAAVLAFNRENNKKFALLAVFVFACVFVRGLAHYSNVNFENDGFLSAYAGKRASLCAEITKEPMKSGAEARILASDGNKTNVKVFIKSYEIRNYSQGYKLYLSGTVKPTEEAVGANTLWAKSMLRRGIKSVITDTTVTGVEYDLQNGNAGIQKTLYNYFSGKIEGVLGYISDKEDYSRARAIAYALLLGDRSKFAPGDYALFRACGITHILCISGMHFSVIMTVLMYLFSLSGGVFGRSVKAKRIFLISGAVFYLTVSAFAISAVRAAIMTVCSLFAPEEKRRYGGAERLLFALSLIVFVSPQAVFDVGLHLSFLACAGIIFASYFYEIFQNKYKNNTVLCTLFLLFAISVSAFSFTSPYLAALYGSAYPAAIAASFAVSLPTAITLIFTWIIALVPRFSLAFSGKILSYAYSFCSQILYKTAQFFSSLSFAGFEADFTDVSLVLFFAVVLLCAISAGKRTRGAKIFVSFSLVAALAAAVTTLLP